MSKWHDRDKSGMMVVIAPDGSLALVLGDGRGREETLSTEHPLLAREWYFVAVSYDAPTRAVTLYQEPLVQYPLTADAAEVHTTARTERLGKNRGPLMFAAFRSGRGRTVFDGKYNGKIDSPRLANRALHRLEMEMVKNGPLSPTCAMQRSGHGISPAISARHGYRIYHPMRYTGKPSVCRRGA